jgi:hypothetical protein
MCGRINDKAVSSINIFVAVKSIDNVAEMVIIEAKYPIERVLRNGQGRLITESELATGKQIRSLAKVKKVALLHW